MTFEITKLLNDWKFSIRIRRNYGVGIHDQYPLPQEALFSSIRNVRSGQV